MTTEEMTFIEDLMKKYCKVYKEVLTADEASEFLGIEKSYLYKLTSQRKIPCYKPMGKMCYFDRKELQSWMLQNRRSTDEEIQSQAISYCQRNRFL